MKTPNHLAPFGQIFMFPNDIINFGKHKGETICEIIDNEKQYYNWLREKGLMVSGLVQKYSIGVNEVQQKIFHTVDKKNDKLLIQKQTYYLLPKEKFVRKQDKIKIISTERVSEYPITIPYAVKNETRSRSWHGGGMQQDDINCYEEWEVSVKYYEEPELSKFINEKLLLHAI